ncbi:MAG: baseplate protein [Methanoculleus sp. SDB]|nr:MAG: baseplate protein [Methanoculleus sp. SDB]
MVTGKEFLGTGWKFPIKTDSSGHIALSTGEEDISEAIRIILLTSPGERVMRPDFGCGIRDYIFASMNAKTLALIETSVREALIKYEPRIEVLDVKADATDAALGKLLIGLIYRVRATNTVFNRVYPFYLTEG